MKYVKKSEILEVLQKFIDARTDKNCSKQQIIERRAFEYTKAIVEQVREYDIDE